MIESLAQLWDKGDIVIKILFCASVVLLTIVLEKSYIFIRFLLELKKVKKMKALSEVEQLKKGDLKTFFEDIHDHIRADTAVTEHLIAVKFDRVDKQLMRYVTVLGLIATLAPMLGLTGTFAGVLKVFEGVASQGLNDPKLVAAGIEEVLVDTIAGLVVAIPAMIAYKTFEINAGKLSSSLEEKLYLFIEHEEKNR